MPGKKRTKKILIGIFVLLLALAIAFQVFIDRWLEPVIHNRLETLIVAGSDSLYTFQLDDINVNFWAGSVEVKNLHIKVDSLHYVQREEAGTLPALTFAVDLAKGSITEIRLLELVFKKKINISTILSKEVNITLSRHFRKSVKKITKNNEPLWKSIRPEIKTIAIDRIILKDINLKYSNADSAKAFKWKFEHCSAVIDDTRVDSTTADDNSRILFSKDVSILFNNIKLQTADELYAIESKQIRYSSEKKSLDADDFKLHPVLDQRAFYKKTGYDKDRIAVSFPQVKFINFELLTWINRNTVSIDTIEVDKPHVNVYKDRTAPMDMRSKYGKFPHQLLREAPFSIHVRQIKVSDGTMTYTEKNEKSKMEGKLIFQNLHGSITNITNDDDQIKKNSKCVADLRGLFMDRSPIHSVFTFHLNETKNGSFEVNTDIENIHAGQLNPITVPLAQASVKSFDIKELHYYIKGNERAGAGNLSLLYNNLEVELKKVDEDDGKIKKKEVLSFLVNKLVVYPDNPMKDEERKAMNIRTERVPNKSFFNLIWKTLYASVKDITIRIDQLKKDKTQKKK